MTNCPFGLLMSAAIFESVLFGETPAETVNPVVSKANACLCAPARRGHDRLLRQRRRYSGRGCLSHARRMKAWHASAVGSMTNCPFGLLMSAAIFESVLFGERPDVDMTDYCANEGVTPAEAVSRMRAEVFETTGSGVTPSLAQ
jgi:hypothetical protein